MARPMPVLPLVASMTVCPGLSSPERSAASMTPNARRSLTEPRGLKASILAKRLTPRGASLLIRTTGVLPIVSRMLLNLVIGGLRVGRDPVAIDAPGGQPVPLPGLWRGAGGALVQDIVSAAL